MATTTKKEKNYPLLPRREIESLISEGKQIIIVDGYALKLDAWMQYHPGGDKAIQHVVGRDATDEVNGLHSEEARGMMKRYRIGRVEEGKWKNFLSPIQGGYFRGRNEEGEEWESGSGSEEGSSVFDEGLRNRKGGSSSASSVEEDEGKDGMAHLDALTKEEIKLDLQRYPALDTETQERIVEKYRELHERIKGAGLYDCDYKAYAIEGTRYAIFFGLFLFFLKRKWYIPSAVFLGIFWHQLVFTAHDAGHMGITHNFQVDTVIGILIADFAGGLSLGWWKRNHNVHHIVTNSPEHDPDIEHMPFFAISHRFLQGLRSSYYERVMEYDAAARFFISVQHNLYYVIMLFARFNLYRLSWEYILKGQGPKKGVAAWHRYLEFAGQVFFWWWFGYGVMCRSIEGNWNRFWFLMVSHAVTCPLHVQITLSHFAMSTADLGVDECFAQRMLRTTMDVDCPTWLDFFHGGLQFQAIHHLFPRFPRHNLRKSQKMVQEFCEDVGIPYALYGFVDGNKVVLGRLEEVARQAAILKKCRDVFMEGEKGKH
ncbi:putative fatty acid desaturase [Podospora fimiseda]|uniref:Delta 8-(E)-sphingolipid desaturase n=1 Tax=Podospora fimiseda TaxID=252190 RepID=A0AAN7H3I2_9PEZI|nr:putative fatty acid desaturase [Podospora fimiseda]